MPKAETQFLNQGFLEITESKWKSLGFGLFLLLGLPAYWFLIDGLLPLDLSLGIEVLLFLLGAYLCVDGIKNFKNPLVVMRLDEKGLSSMESHWIDFGTIAWTDITKVQSTRRKKDQFLEITDKSGKVHKVKMDGLNVTANQLARIVQEKSHIN